MSRFTSSSDNAGSTRQMTSQIRVGIVGLGFYLPPEVRRNDWWAPSLVDHWMERRQAAPHEELDPFQGTVERRIMPRHMTVLDMEEAAARAAIAHAGIDARAVDLLLTYSVLPDVLLGNPAFALHRRLDLSSGCLSLHTDAAGDSFLVQLALAEALIVAGRARCALLVQSSAPSRRLDMSDPSAPIFGDAATAAVVHPVSGASGVEASVSLTGGAGVPGQATTDPAQVVEACKQTIDAALQRAGHHARDVRLLCMHQAPWLCRLVIEAAGLHNAQTLDTYAQTGHIYASGIPAQLALAEKQGLVGAGELVVLAGGATGGAHGAVVLRWGGGSLTRGAITGGAP